MSGGPECPSWDPNVQDLKVRAPYFHSAIRIETIVNLELAFRQKNMC